MTITLSATTPVAVPPRVQLNVTSSPAVSAEMTVTRIHADGSEHPVLGVGSLVGAWAGLDLHPPYNTPVTYRAEAAGFTSTSGAVTVASTRSWLIHASDPDLSMVLQGVGPVAPRTRPSRATRYEPLGGKLPVFRVDAPRGGRSGEVQALCWTPAELAALTALLADGGPLLLATVTPLGWLWVQPGTTSEDYAGGGWIRNETIVSIPWEECEAPNADAGVWTLDELDTRALTLYPTLDQMDTAYAGRVLNDVDLRVV